jgi:hypothetical protein
VKLTPDFSVDSCARFASCETEDYA